MKTTWSEPKKPGVSFRSDKKLYLPCKSINMVDCLKMLCTPFYPMVLLIIIPIINGYFIGKINPTFPDKPGGLSRFLNGTIIFLRPQYCWIDPPSPTAMETRFISTCITIIYIYIYMYIYVQIKIYNTLHHITSRGIALHCIFTLHT